MAYFIVLNFIQCLDIAPEIDALLQVPEF